MLGLEDRVVEEPPRDDFLHAPTSAKVNYERFWARFGCPQSLEVIDRGRENNQQNYDNCIFIERRTVS